MKARELSSLLVLVLAGCGSSGGNSGAPAVTCSPADLSTISAVQGTGVASPLVGQQVSVAGVVTAAQEGGGVFGFFVEDPERPGQASGASDGLFVYTGDQPAGVKPGQWVQVTGKVQEYYELTELGAGSQVEICGSAKVPAPLKFQAPMEWEAVEGMRVSVSELFATAATNHYGEATLYQEPYLYSGQGVAAAFLARLGPPLSGEPLDIAAGQEVSAFGPVTYSYGKYLILPQEYDSEGSGRGSPLPEWGNGLRVVSFNAENFFTTLSSENENARGPSTEAEYQVKHAKMGQVLVNLGADLYALIEIENDGAEMDLDGEKALDEIVALAGTDYRGLRLAGGTDAIQVAFVYNSKELKMARAENFQGCWDGTVSSAILLELASDTCPAGLEPAFKRLPLAATFSHEGEEFVAIAQHWKSKAGDPAESEAERVASARLTQEIVQRYRDTGEDQILLLGDFNAYLGEEPIDYLVAAGFNDLIAELPAEQSYTYAFNGELGALDHALASPELAPAIKGTWIWHLATSWPYPVYGPDPDSPYAASDHDAIALELEF